MGTLTPRLILLRGFALQGNSVLSGYFYYHVSLYLGNLLAPLSLCPVWPRAPVQAPFHPSWSLHRSRLFLLLFEHPRVLSPGSRCSESIQRHTFDCVTERKTPRPGHIYTPSELVPWGMYTRVPVFRLYSCHFQPSVCLRRLVRRL